MAEAVNMRAGQKVILSLLGAAAAMLALGGCRSGSKATTQPAEPQRMTVLTPDAHTLVYRQMTLDDRPADPDAAVMVHLDVYDIQVPAGSISNSSPFAAMVDEQALGGAARETLARNGIRAGLVDRVRWDQLRGILSNHPATTTPTRVLGTTGRAELMIAREIASQTLFYTDPQGELIGRSYDLSDNFWALRFIPLPRQPGDTSLSLCPVVRTSRERVELTRGSREVQVPYTQPEALYDVSLTVRVPLEKFLIVWPGADAARHRTLLGAAFLISGDYPRPMEHILVFVPVVFHLDEEATNKLKARGN